MILHGVAFLSWNQHPEPKGSRRATPLLPFQHSSGHPLATRQHWLRPEWLAKYAPELNDIEREWKTLKGHHLAHKTFKTAGSLKTAIDEEIKAINANRKHRPWVNNESLLSRRIARGLRR
jgi:DDE superfamily endonuclease